MKKSLLLALGLLLSQSGCIYVTAVKSTQGKAYVVKGSPFGSTLWNCDATSGEPTCYRVVEVPLAK